MWKWGHSLNSMNKVVIIWHVDQMDAIKQEKIKVNHQMMDQAGLRAAEVKIEGEVNYSTPFSTPFFTA